MLIKDFSDIYRTVGSAWTRIPSVLKRNFVVNGSPILNMDFFVFLLWFRLAALPYFDTHDRYLFFICTIDHRLGHLQPQSYISKVSHLSVGQVWYVSGTRDQVL